MSETVITHSYGSLTTARRGVLLFPLPRTSAVGYRRLPGFTSGVRRRRVPSREERKVEARAPIAKARTATDANPAGPTLIRRHDSVSFTLLARHVPQDVSRDGAAVHPRPGRMRERSGPRRVDGSAHACSDCNSCSDAYANRNGRAHGSGNGSAILGTA